VDDRRVAGGRLHPRGGIASSADLRLVALGYSLGIDGLALLELTGWERIVAGHALAEASTWVRDRMASAISKAIEG
jgi:hypothetical protein